MANQDTKLRDDAFPLDTAIDRVRALGDVLVSCDKPHLNENTLPTIGGMLFELADRIEVLVSKGGN